VKKSVRLPALRIRPQASKHRIQGITGNNREFSRKKTASSNIKRLAFRNLPEQGISGREREFARFKVRLHMLIFPKSHGLADNCKSDLLRSGGMS
jgi:hypothetical protein